jgi:predicted nucleic-acid-binding protein
MVDDSIHTFYGSHCDYFITIDDKCKYKAGQTFEKLNISTKVFTPEEFIQEMK